MYLQLFYILLEENEIRFRRYVMLSVLNQLYNLLGSTEEIALHLGRAGIKWCFLLEWNFLSELHELLFEIFNGNLIPLALATCAVVK